ncbi:hypothetical protein ABPG72_019658 [Tetrahymena utriculariae]
MDQDKYQNDSQILQESIFTEPARSMKRSKTQAPTRQRGNFLIDVIRRDSINVENIKFKEKEYWKQSDFCNLCQTKYNTIMFVKQHHCRLCGESVCKECSKKKINEQRVCDFCFLKCNDYKQAQRRKNDLQNMVEQIECLKVAINKYDQSIVDINAQICANQENQKEELKQFALEEGELQLEEKKLTIKIEQTKEDNDQQKTLSKNLEKESTQNKTNITELKIQINKLNIDLESVKHNVELKNKEIENIKQLLKNVQNSQSFQDLSVVRQTQNQELSQNENQFAQSSIYIGHKSDESTIERYEYNSDG